MRDSCWRPGCILAQEKKRAFHSWGGWVGILAPSSFYAVDPRSPCLLGRNRGQCLSLRPGLLPPRGDRMYMAVPGTWNTKCSFIFTSIFTCLNCFLIIPVLLLDLPPECPPPTPSTDVPVRALSYCSPHTNACMNTPPLNQQHKLGPPRSLPAFPELLTTHLSP